MRQRDPGGVYARNKEAYSTDEAAQHYAFREDRLEGEEAIIQKLGSRLSTMRMLDIGVGGGRTTERFAPLVREYVGVDYAPGMIDACHRRFPTPPPHVSFRVADATAMDMFSDSSFDFILFSFNGIDGLSHELRLQVLREVRRVGRNGAAFAFSSNNLRSLPRLWAFRLSRRPRVLLQRIRAFVMLRWENRPYRALLRQPFALVYEWGHPLKLTHYHVKPEEQLRQLLTTGFRDVLVYGMDGEEIAPPRLPSRTDTWLYYLSVIAK